jgi:hypothetical protein
MPPATPAPSRMHNHDLRLRDEIGQLPCTIQIGVDWHRVRDLDQGPD